LRQPNGAALALERGVRSDSSLVSRRAATFDRTDIMYALFLTLAALIFSTAGRFDPYLTRVSDTSAIYTVPDSIPYPTDEQASVCRWLRLISGLELC
jgi:hypothetical protein